MPDIINPISNEDDLRREANAVPERPVVAQQAPVQTIPVNNTPSPSASQPIPTSSAPNVSIMALPGAQTYTASPNISRTDYHPYNSRATIMDDINAPFSNRLPAFSYILAWLWSFAAVIIAILLFVNLNLVIKETNLINLTSPESSWMYTSKEDTSKVIDGLYQTTVWPLAIALSACIVTVFCLMSGRRIFRYIGLLISVAIIGYVLYLIFKDFKFGPSSDSSSSTSSATTSMSDYDKATFDVWSASSMALFANMYAAYVPFTILPAMTIIYLLGSKADQAYQ